MKKLSSKGLGPSQLNSGPGRFKPTVQHAEPTEAGDHFAALCPHRCVIADVRDRCALTTLLPPLKEADGRSFLLRPIFCPIVR
jgi:hypothetical protein